MTKPATSSATASAQQTEPLAANQPIHQQQTEKSAKKHAPLYIVAGVVTLVAGSGGFVAGMALGAKANLDSPSARPGRDRSAEGMGMMRQRGDLSTVTAISNESITVSIQLNRPDQQSSDADSTKTKTYTINTSTIISDDGDDATANDIKIGDRVAIQPSSDDDTIAASISINPVMDDKSGPNRQNGQTQSYDSSTSLPYDISNT